MFGIDVPRSTAPHGALACRAEAVSPVPPDPLAGARHLIICLLGPLGPVKSWGDRLTASFQHICNFRFSFSFVPRFSKEHGCASIWWRKLWKAGQGSARRSA